MTTASIDFAEIMQSITIEKVAREMLNLPIARSGTQFRCACPVHGGGPRGLAVTPNKPNRRGTMGVWFCQASKEGGDSIGLAAHILKLEQLEAAKQIHTRFALITSSEPIRHSSASPPARKDGQGFDLEEYARRLDPSHSALEGLGLSPETLTVFKAGYVASTGILSRRLALPLENGQGVIGYFGLSLSDEDTPVLKFYKGHDPKQHIFNIGKAEGEVRLVADVLTVLKCHEFGETAISFLTDLIEPEQFELLAALQVEKNFRVFY